MGVQTGWAVVCYYPDGVRASSGDRATFDGWYFDHAEAAEVYRYLCDEHPDIVVSLVEGRSSQYPIVYRNGSSAESTGINSPSR